MRIILLGPPGSGKGTQAPILAEKLGILAIASGDMFRAAIAKQTAVGMEAQGYMNAGELVPDATTIRLVTERLTEADCANGFILDGFPRTLPQAQELGEKIAIDKVIDITCDEEILIQRISGRRVHLPSGRVYHIDHHPPQVAGKDDETGEDLIQRDDDLPETIRKRLAVYTEQTKPLSEFYQNGDQPTYHEIDGNQEIAAITQAMLAVARS